MYCCTGLRSTAVPVISYVEVLLPDTKPCLVWGYPPIKAFGSEDVCTAGGIHTPVHHQYTITRVGIPLYIWHFFSRPVHWFNRSVHERTAAAAGTPLWQKSYRFVLRAFSFFLSVFFNHGHYPVHSCAPYARSTLPAPLSHNHRSTLSIPCTRQQTWSHSNGELGILLCEKSTYSSIPMYVRGIEPEQHHNIPQQHRLSTQTDAAESLEVESQKFKSFPHDVQCCLPSTVVLLL